MNFYQGIGLLTKAEEKRFSKERKILAVESSEGTEEEDNSRPIVPTQTTARGLVQVDVLQTRERPERQLAKRRKVMTDDEEDSLLDLRMAETGIWQSSTQARPKKKAKRMVVVTKSSYSNVEKTVAVAVATAKDNTNEPTLQVVERRPSTVLVEVPTDVAMEPSEERKETSSPSFLSSEQT